MRGRILVVDDEAAIGRMLVRHFEAQHLHAEFTTDAEEGLKLLADRRFDVLISDLRMPKVDGLEFLEQAKSIRPDCAVVVMTGFPTVFTTRHAMELGAADYIAKPFALDTDLQPIIEGLLSSAAASKAEKASCPA